MRAWCSIALLALSGTAAAAPPREAPPVHWPQLELQGVLTLADDGVWAKRIQVKLLAFEREAGGDPVWVERVDRIKAREGKLTFRSGRSSSWAERGLLDPASPRDLWLEVTLTAVDDNRFQDVFAPRMRLTTAEPFGFACTEPTALEGQAYRLRLACVPGPGVAKKVKKVKKAR